MTDLSRAFDDAEENKIDRLLKKKQRPKAQQNPIEKNASNEEKSRSQEKRFSGPLAPLKTLLFEIDNIIIREEWGRTSRFKPFKAFFILPTPIKGKIEWQNTLVYPRIKIEPYQPFLDRFEIDLKSIYFVKQAQKSYVGGGFESAPTLSKSVEDMKYECLIMKIAVKELHDNQHWFDINPSDWHQNFDASSINKTKNIDGFEIAVDRYEGTDIKEAIKTIAEVFGQVVRGDTYRNNIKKVLSTVQQELNALKM